tara:strand:- start:568 stop:1722 length:1155 start_codon:yes stop_codon:yes gene_type:complete
MISEEDLAQGNAPDESKQRVRQITKAIRYKARKEGGNLFKAFNDYMSSSSGVTATDRVSVKQSLGLSERYSSWREEIREIADVPSSKAKKDTEMSKEVKEKKVNNKITINPDMKEAFEEIGAEVLDVFELSEEDIQEIAPAALGAAALKGGKVALGFAARRIAPAAIRATGSALGGVAKGAGAAVSGAASLGAAAAKAGSSAPAKKQTSGSSVNTNTTMSGTQKEEVGSTTGQMDPQQKQMLKNKEQMMKRQQMLSKQRIQMQKQGRLPMGHSEGYAPGDVDQKVGAVTAIPKKDQDDARARILAKAAAKRKAKGVKEETEDSLRDRRMERGGVDGNNRYDRAPKPANTAGKKKPYDGMSALEKVKASIRAKHGDGAIMDTKKK